MDEIVKDFLIEGNENESNQNESNQNLDRLDRELGEAGEWAFLEKNYGPALSGRSTPCHAIQGSCGPGAYTYLQDEARSVVWDMPGFRGTSAGVGGQSLAARSYWAEIIRSPAMPIAARTHAGDGLTLG